MWWSSKILQTRIADECHVHRKTAAYSICIFGRDIDKNVGSAGHMSPQKHRVLGVRVSLGALGRNSIQGSKWKATACRCAQWTLHNSRSVWVVSPSHLGNCVVPSLHSHASWPCATRRSSWRGLLKSVLEKIRNRQHFAVLFCFFFSAMQVWLCQVLARPKWMHDKC